MFQVIGLRRGPHFPGIRETLEALGNVARRAVRDLPSARLVSTARKVVANENEPVDAVMRYLEKHPADLIVLATSQRDGHVRWLGKSSSEPVARKAGRNDSLDSG